MTTPNENMTLVAIVDMADGHADTGHQYEDQVLALLGRHGGVIDWRFRGIDGTSEVHLIRFQSRAGYESFMVDPERMAFRAALGETAPTTRVIEVEPV
jgi:hypothetical protein